VTIVANGSLMPEALRACDILSSRGIASIVIHASSVNQPDVETISQALKKTSGRLVTVEDHRKVGGMGAILCHALCTADVAFKIRSLGVADEFGQSAYSAADLHARHGLDAAAIAAAAVKMIEQGV
jgi:transketolase